MKKAIFIDRDGVINKLLDNHPGRHDKSNYVVSWKQFDFLPGVMEAFQLIRQTDYLPIVVSNQSGIGRGYATYFDILRIFQRMNDEINVPTLSYIFCPHTPEDNCACRKPKPGMLYKMAVDQGIDLSQSWMIGDQQTDIDAGRNAGIPLSHLIKIIPDYNYDQYKQLSNPTYFVLRNLLEAVECITENFQLKTENSLNHATIQSPPKT